MLFLRASYFLLTFLITPPANPSVSVDALTETDLEYPVSAPADPAISQHRLAGARAGDTTLVVWEEQTGGGSSRIAGSGVPADLIMPDDPELILADGAMEQRSPAVATNGSEFLIVWYSRNDQRSPYRLLGIRLSAGLEVLDPEPITIASAVFPVPMRREADFNEPPPPAVVWNGEQYLVVAQSIELDELGFFASEHLLFLWRVTSDGVVLDRSGIRLPEWRVWLPQVRPAMASNGEISLLVWQDGTNVYQCPFECAGPVPGRIFGVRLDRSGLLLDPVPFAISPGATYELEPAVAWSGSVFLVAWYANLQQITFFAHPGTFGSRVAASGEVLDRTPMLIADWGIQASLIGTAQSFVVGWQQALDIFTTRITSSGQNVGPILPKRPLVASVDYELNPVVVPLSAGRVGVFYEKYSPESAETAGRRLYFKVMTLPIPRTRPVVR